MNAALMDSTLFLLGGYDLEMIAIKEILLQNGFIKITDLATSFTKAFADRQLVWGAKLSDYNNFLSLPNIIYGIELTEDIKPPSNYNRIDHHNELSCLPSTIEQLAEILGIQLTREQLLIAANDKGYIPAMKAMGATQEEINEIRRKDRQAQGVTDEDERLAEESIREQLRDEDGFTIIKSLTEKFSPVTDRMYGEEGKLIVYTDNKLVYYGNGISKLAEHFSEHIKGGKVYHGGGVRGYFGLVEGAFNKEKIEGELINKIKSITNKNNSSHIFIFPFKWQLNQVESKKNTALFSDFANLEIANDLVLQDKKRWNTDLYNNFNDHEDYNEFIYFYPFVRSVLYDYQEEPNRNTLIRHYIFLPAVSKQLKYIINIKDQKSYELNIEFILLNLYKTGVGLLSFHLKNDILGQQKWDDILNINEYGRRIYPQFLSDGFTMNYTKGTFLANSIEIINKGISPIEGFPIKDDFEKETGITNINVNIKPYELDVVPNHIDKILPKQFRDSICVEPVIDDRMFVISNCYDENNDFSEKIRNLKIDSKEKIISEFNSELYKYIFVDGTKSGGVGNDEFRDKLLKEHTYPRWLGEATFFGVSRYSFVSYSNYFLIPVHTRTMYYKMAELCLIQRASVLTFTEEVSRISRLDEDTKLLTGKLNDLYKNYIQFVNKIYFREVTAQEQGIELYDMMHEKMGIRGEVESLDKEIGELHNYVMLLEEKKRNKQLEIITKQSYKISLYGIPFLIMSLMASILGINMIEGFDFSFNPKLFNIFRLIKILLVVIILILLPGYVFYRIWKKKEFRKTSFKIDN